MQPKTSIRVYDFSIHALLAESDCDCAFISNTLRIFLSTLSLRRATQSGNPLLDTFSAFLSTLSLRRATYYQRSGMDCIQLFYPRSPCGERLDVGAKFWILDLFYPRSPCGERRATVRATATKSFFYPRSPCGERHHRYYTRHRVRHFSIHALLAESDIWTAGQKCGTQLFYPRSPCGERRLALRSTTPIIGLFYPRSPCGERQSLTTYLETSSIFSIHALLAESDIIKERRQSP